MTDENQTPGTETPTEATSEFLAGETKKETSASFNSDDVSKLARMNHDAQEFIKELKTETASMRDEIRALQSELAKSRTVDDLIDLYGQQDQSEPGSKTPPVNEQELLAKLKAEVFQELSVEQQKAQEEANWQDSLKQAEARFGEKYDSYVDARAKDLGISINDMRSYARTSPKVFLELLGGSQKTPQASPTQSSQKAPMGSGETIEAQYARLVRLRKYDTDEGKEARRILSDPDFQQRYREHILTTL